MRQNYVYDDGGGWDDCWWMLLLTGLMAAMIVMMLSGCKSGEVAVVQHTKTDTCYISRVERDSIWMRDSVYVKEKVKGDTVWMEVTRWNRVVKNVTRVDTVYKARVDSVPVPYPVVKEVERKQRWWEKALIWWGVICSAVLVVRLKMKKKLW